MASSRQTGFRAAVEMDASAGSSGGGMSSESTTHFECFSCGQRFRWSPAVAGRTLRCPCGAKIRCPEPRDATFTAAESLDDTVADVELEEHLDQIEADESVEEFIQEATSIRRIPQKGMFGWPIGREVFVWGVLTVVGIALGILALLLHKYFIHYTIAFAAVFPYSAYRLRKSWPRWAQGRSWIECVNDTLGVSEDGDENENGAEKSA